MIALQVHGIPAPQGSKSAIVRNGKARVIEGQSASGRASHVAWRQAVARAARDYLDANPRGPIDEPVSLHVSFLFPVVASDRYRTRHTVKPDLDKLVRSTLDALVSGGLLRDDTVVFSLMAEKHYAREDEPVGAWVRLHLHGETEAQEREDRKAAAAEARKVARQGVPA